MTTDDDAKRLNVEGEKLRQAGDLAGAEARYRQALALVAPDSFVAAIALDNLGTALDAGGDLHAGITSHRAALEILAKHPDKVLDIAITANNTGLAYRLLGNRPLAMHYFEMAKQYHESVGATDHYLGTLLNIAALDGDDDAEKGLREIEDMLGYCAAFQQRYGRPSKHANLGALVRAQLLIRTGNLDAAAPILEQAVPVFRQLEGPLGEHTLDARQSWAELLYRRDDPRAESELLEVLGDQVAQGQLGAAEKTRSLLSEHYFLHDRLREQVLMLDANVGSEERRTAALVLEGSQDEALDAAAYEVRQLGRLLSAVDTQHETSPDLVGMALEHWLRRKVMTRAVLQRSAGLERAGQDPAAEAELSTLRDQLDEDVRIATEGFVRPDAEWAQRQERIRVDRARIAELERTLGRRLALTGVTILQSDLVAGLQAALGETVLIEICALAAHRTSAADAPDETWEHGYAAFVVTGDAAAKPRYRWLGSWDEIDALVTTTLAEIGSGRRPRALSGALAAAGPPTFGESVTAGLQSLSTALADLVPPSAERIVVSADRQLGALPLQLLPLPRGQWLDRFEISYLASGADLVAAAAPTPESAGPPLVLAAPRYSAHGRTTPFADLRGAEQEGRAVAAVLGTTALTGPEATKAAVLDATRPVVVHLATHAFYGAADSVAITLSTRQPAASADDPQPKTVADLSFADPDDLRRQLVRAGLALAGANDAELEQRRAVGDPSRDLDYGRLLAIDVLALDLAATELVVLSACDTGRGRAIIAQGLWGLPLALQAAGARRTVSSLWPVDDDSTRELMTRFYSELVQGATPAAALRTAARQVRGTHPEPRYWAPFVLIGDSRPVAALRRPAPSA